MKLYDLADEYRNFVAEVEAYDLEPQTLLDTLEGSTQLMSIEEKAGNIVKMVKNWKSDLPGLKEEIEKLTEKKRIIENRVEQVETFLFSVLEYSGLSEIKTPIATVKQQKNPASVVIEDEKLVPAKFQTIVPESYKISKKEIAAAIRNGEEVPGCKLEQTKRWVIK